MVVVFYGTSAELIKLLGIVKGIPREEQFLICTAQQREQLDKFHAQSSIQPDFYLAQGWRGRDVLNMFEMLGFMIKVHLNFMKNYRYLRGIIARHDREKNTSSVAIVHGDTLTTVVGAYLGRFLRLPVAHIEAGLRSGKIMHPFPEEIDRRIVSRIARIHFAPNEAAITNLAKENTKGDIVNTYFNTSKDAMEVANTYKSKLVSSLKLPKHYGLVSIHRTELLERKKELRDFLEVIGGAVSDKQPLVFLDHSTTQEKLRILGLDNLIDKPGMYRIPKLAYMDFIQVVKRADYIITDSGGLQEDAYFLGVPTIIHRLATERNEGLGLNVELSYLKKDALQQFINRQRNERKIKRLDDKTSPSEIVIKYLKNNRFIG